MSIKTRTRSSLACALSLLSLLALLIIPALSLAGAGCDGKTKTTAPDTPDNADPAAFEILSASAVKLVESASYRTESVSELVSNSGLDEAMPSMTVIECEMVDGAWNKKMTSNSSVEAMQEGYVIGDTMYVKSEGEWFYRKDPVTMAKRNLVDLATPESIRLAIDNADEVSLVSEDTSSATCRLKLEQRYYDAVIAELEKIAADLGTKTSARQIKELEKSLSSMKMQVDITIDKQTGLFSSMVISMLMGGIAGPDVPAPQMTLTVETTFSDYGKDFDISLPEEAGDAQPVSTGIQGDMSR